MSNDLEVIYGPVKYDGSISRIVRKDGRMYAETWSGGRWKAGVERDDKVFCEGYYVENEKLAAIGIPESDWPKPEPEEIAG